MSLPTPVRIFESRRAPNPRRVGVFLAEKGVEVERVELDIMSGEHYQDAHISRAGTHQIPVIELSDGSFLSETVAICRYLEALYPDPNLMGGDPLEVAQIEMWQRRVEMGLLLNIAQVIRHTIPAMNALEHVQVPDWGEACKPRVEKSLRDLNTRLEMSPFIACDRFTIADITASVAVGFMRVLRQNPPEDCVALNSWYANIKERPSSAA